MMLSEQGGGRRFLSTIFWPVLLVAIFTILFPKVWINFDSGYLGGVRSDPGLYVWLSRYNIEHVLSWNSVGLNGALFYPFGQTLAYSDNFIFPALLAKPIYLLTGNHAFAYNTVWVMASLLNGYATFLLFQYLFKDRFCALFAGSVFMGCPYFIWHSSHPQLQFAFFFPLILLFLFKYWSTRRWIWATSIGTLIVLAFLTSAYYSIYASFLVCVAMVGLVIAEPSAIIKIPKLVAANIPWMLLLLLFSGPYKATRETFGEISPWMVRHYSPSLLSYVAAPFQNKLWSGLTAGLSSIESWLFCGFSVLAIGLIGMTTAFGKEKQVALWGWITCLVSAVVATIAFFGHADRMTAVAISLPLWGLIIISAYNLWLSRMGDPSNWGPLLVLIFSVLLFASIGIVGPYDLKGPEIYGILYRFFPGFDALRGVSRLGIIVILIVTLMAAALLVDVRKRYRLGNIIFAVFFLFAMLEIRTSSLKVRKPILPNSVYQELAKIPGNEAVLVLPFGTVDGNVKKFSQMQVEYMNQLLITSRPHVNGYSGKIPRLQYYEGRVFDKFPDEESLTKIGSLVGVRYILIDRRYLSIDKLDSIKNRMEKYPEQLKIIYSHPTDGMLIEFNPVLKLAKLNSGKLYVPPDTSRSRRIDLLIRNNNQLGKGLGLTFNMGGEPIYQASIVSNNWEKLSFDIPKSNQSVRPQSIVISAGDSELAVEIKDVRLVQTN